MTHSPDSGDWVLQDLDMYEQDRVPSSFPIKTEVTADSGEYGSPGSLRAQSCALAGSTHGYPGLNGQYGNMPGYDSLANVPQQPSNQGNSGEWPSDLENIFINQCPPLPSECDSPLKLEDYNMFVYVDPSTLDPSSSTHTTSVPSAPSLASSAPTQSLAVRPPFNSNNNANSTCPPPCSQMSYNSSSAACAAPLSSAKPLGALPMPQYAPVPPPTFSSGTTESAMHPEMPGRGACVPSQTPRVPGSRGRPRNDWRPRKNCVGRPRSKTGRVGRPLSVKTEPYDMSDSLSFSDPTEEKKERRREQNRRAARKLREKKKVHVENMKKSYEGIIQDNRRLTQEVASLRDEVQMLRRARDNHVCSCRDGFTPSPASTSSRPASNYGNTAPHTDHADISSFSHAD